MARGYLIRGMLAGLLAGLTIGRRTALYFLAIAVGLLAVALAATLERRLALRLGHWDATLVAGIVLVGVVALAHVAMPGVDEVPAAFPASLLWRFRLASAGTELTLWSVLGISFGGLTERAQKRVRRVGAQQFTTATS